MTFAWTKRLVDVLLSTTALALFAVPMLIIWLAVRSSSPGPALYWSERVGRNNVPFAMPKFRSMRVDTPTVATHLLDDPQRFVTPVGRFLRKTSLDELPQLWTILRGHMSFVGPRPALYNQDDLIHAREERGVHTLTPGLTGWAQVNGRDELSVQAKVAYDAWYAENASLALDLRIFVLTVVLAVRGRHVAH